MAIVNANLASFQVVTNEIGPYCDSITFTRQNDTPDVTTFGNTGHKYTATLTDGSIALAGVWDKTATVGSYTVLSVLVGDLDGAAFIYGPEGSATGKVKYSGTMILESYAESAAVADVVRFTATAKISGAVTIGAF